MRLLERTKRTNTKRPTVLKMLTSEPEVNSYSILKCSGSLGFEPILDTSAIDDKIAESVREY